MNFRRDIGYSGRGSDDINRKPPTAEQSIPSVWSRVFLRASIYVYMPVLRVRTPMRVSRSYVDRSTIRPADPRR